MKGKTVWRFLQKLKIELPWSTYSTSRYLSKENENINPQRYIHPCVHHSIIYNSQEMGATKVSVNVWCMDKEDITHTHTQTGNHSTIKKEGNLAIWDSMDASGGYCAKWNKSERNTNTTRFHLHVEAKKQSKWSMFQIPICKTGSIKKMNVSWHWLNVNHPLVKPHASRRFHVTQDF